MASDDPVETLARRVTALPERSMHWRAILETLRSVPIEEAAGLVEGVLDRPVTASHRPDLLRLRMLEVIAGNAPMPEQALDADFRRALHAAAEERGAESIQRHLRSLAEVADPDVLARRLPKDVAEIPLGRRRSLAKGSDPNLLEKLALDPDTIVLENLLRNPRTREAEVVRIAALRPIGGDSLRCIDGDPRWQSNPRIRAAIARNPYCPIELAMKLVATLGTGVLREIAEEAGLVWPVREAILLEIDARDRLEGRLSDSA